MLPETPPTRSPTTTHLYEAGGRGVELQAALQDRPAPVPALRLVEPVTPLLHLRPGDPCLAQRGLPVQQLLENVPALQISGNENRLAVRKARQVDL